MALRPLAAGDCVALATAFRAQGWKTPEAKSDRLLAAQIKGESQTLVSTHDPAPNSAAKPNSLQRLDRQAFAFPHRDARPMMTGCGPNRAAPTTSPWLDGCREPRCPVHSEFDLPPCWQQLAVARSAIVRYGRNG